MWKEIMTYGNIKTEKHKYHHHENLILLDDIDTDNIEVSGLVSSGIFSIFF